MGGSPEDDTSDLEYHEGDGLSDARGWLSDEWDEDHQIWHEPQPLSPLTPTQSPAEPAPASPDVPSDDPLVVEMAALTRDPEETGNHPFTLDSLATHLGQKWKARDLHVILEVCYIVCTCGQVVTESEISRYEGIIRCKSAGCKTGWVSFETFLESVSHTTETAYSTTSNVLTWSTLLVVRSIKINIFQWM